MSIYLSFLVFLVLLLSKFILYYGIYFGILIALLDGFWKYFLGIVPLLLACVMTAVCIERIKEIRSGEEDDLSKY